MLAIPMFRIPDVNDTNAQLPPSQNSPVAASLLLACSAAGDLQATLQILNAVYYSSKVHNMPQAGEIARLFTPKDIDDCRKMLEQLAEGKDGKGAAKGDANAMTLHGKFLELAGNTEEARYFYEKALERYNTKIFRGYPHPMAFPWLTPWTELVNLEETFQTPSIEKMTEALKFGALKADDPMAYYKLATLQDKKSPEWLTYMSKAAASGHPEAMYRLGQFYQEVNAQPSNFLNNAGFKKALKFITSWRRNASADFGMEWLKVAAMGGHKPAMMEMARLYEQNEREDATEQAMNCLRGVVKEPPLGIREEWPHLVMQARQRLAALQSAHKDQRQLA
jgi:TPR repeat protein